MAIQLSCRFAEIFQDVPAQALVRVTVIDHLVQFIGRFAVVRLAVQQLIDDDVLRRKQQDDTRFLAVTPRPSGFLVIAFDVFGHVVVVNGPHIAFVDSHPESIRCDHDRFAVEQEIILVPLALVFRQPGMVQRHSKAFLFQFFLDRFHIFSGRAIDDARFLRVEVLHEKLELIGGLFHAEGQIAAVKSRHQAERLLQAQLDHNIVLDRFGGSCGEGCNPWTSAKNIVQSGHTLVGRPEIAAPL